MSRCVSLSNDRFLVYWVTILGLIISPAVAGAEWNWANPTPHGHTIQASAYCDGTWVAVGQYGLLYTSGDGIEWQQREIATTEWLNGVACNGTTIVVVGSGGVVLTSPDGVSWTSGSSGTDSILLDVVWDPPQGGGFAGAFIAVGSELVVLSSADGFSWDEENPPSGDIGENLWGVVNNGDGSLLVATGGNCYTQCEVSTMMVSDDHGDSWTSTTYTVDEWMGIAADVTWGNPTTRAPLFVAAHWDGTVVTSPDGLSWMPRPTGTTYPLYDVAWDGSQFVACGARGNVLSSPDAATWTLQASNTELWLSGIDAGGGILVTTGVACTLITSADGVAWTHRMAPSGRADLSLKDVAWSPVLGVTVDLNTSVYGVSPDGWSWTFDDDTSGTSPAPAYDIGWFPVDGSGLYVSVGRTGRIVTSPDGLTWTGQVSGVSATLRRVGWDGDVFLVVGSSGVVLTSPDGVIWTPETSNTSTTLNGVACGGSTCVAVGNGVFVTRSGGVWSPVETVGNYYAVTHNGAIYAAVGFEGVILTSPDGVTWTSQVSGVETSLYDVGVVTGDLIAVGYQGVILTSSDGVSWTAEISGTSNLLRGISSGKGLAVGQDGTILHRGLFADGFESGSTSAWPGL